MTTTIEMIERIAVAAEKLLLETSRLRRDVDALNKRIEPVEGLPSADGSDKPIKLTKRGVIDSLNMIEMARATVLNCERDLSAIRGRIDAIESDAISRDEMKPWIKR